MDAEVTRVKPIYKASLTLYVLLLLWLILFKTSTDFSSVLSGYQSRSLNLIPFVDFSVSSLSETVSNFIVFIPLGLLLGVNLGQVSFWRRLGFIAAFSVAVETLQYVLAIGVSDITDVISNVLGGLFGLAVYDLVAKYVDTGKLNRSIVIAIIGLLAILLVLRFLVFKVRY